MSVESTILYDTLENKPPRCLLYMTGRMIQKKKKYSSHQWHFRYTMIPPIPVACVATTRHTMRAEAGPMSVRMTT